jgi:pimeloyl-ACP methyl ester carboxylesterase
MVSGMARWSGTRVGDLAQVSVPTLVVVAGEDLLTPNAESIANAIPGAQLLVVPGAGHAVALESPDPVNEAIAKHLV